MAEDLTGNNVPPSGSFPASGRLAGIDYGTVRVGVAITDPERRLASPLAVLTRRDRTQEARYFQQLVADELIVGFVVGLPVHSHGGESEKSREARRFGDWLTQVTGRSVVYFDERFTTVVAEQLLNSAGLTSQRRKERRDKLAAQILLTAFLESGCRPTEQAESLD